jgi:alpha-amylase
MSTKFFTSGATQAYFNPYDTPYEAYINYMNVLSDFAIRLSALVPVSVNDQEVAGLSQVISEKNELIQKYEAELKRLKSTKSKIEAVAKDASSGSRKTGNPLAKKKQKSLKSTKPKTAGVDKDSSSVGKKSIKSAAKKKPKTKLAKTGKK